MMHYHVVWSRKLKMVGYVLQVPWFNMGCPLLWIRKHCMPILVIHLHSLGHHCSVQCPLPPKFSGIWLNSGSLVPSFNCISKEFFLAATFGLVSWLGMFTYAFIFLAKIWSILSLYLGKFLEINKKLSLDYMPVILIQTQASRTMLAFTGMAVWRDSVAYGHLSPLRSMKELVFGQPWLINGWGKEMKVWKQRNKLRCTNKKMEKVSPWWSSFIRSQ